MILAFLLLPCLAAAAAISGPTTTLKSTVALPAASPYPSSPLPNEFQYHDYNEQDTKDVEACKAVHEAFADFSPMLSAAITSLRNKGDHTFERWFPAEAHGLAICTSRSSRDYVENVLRMVFDPDGRSPTPMVAGFVSERDDFTKRCGAKVSLGRNRDYKSTNPSSKIAAYLHRPTNHLHICPASLRKLGPASKVDCAALGHAVSPKMRSLTEIIVHELMHPLSVGLKVPCSLGRIDDVMYGGAPCAKLAHGPDSQKAFVNADSYTWSAVNAYYNKVCSRTFDPPKEKKRSWLDDWV